VTRKDEDRELVRLFEELRRADDASAPPFRRVLERPQARARAPSLGSVAAVSASVLALLILWLAGSWRPPRGTQRASAGTVGLGDWKSPTDFLLLTPGGELLDSKPTLLERVPDYSQIKSLIREKGARS